MNLEKEKKMVEEISKVSISATQMCVNVYKMHNFK